MGPWMKGTVPWVTATARGACTPPEGGHTRVRHARQAAGQRAPGRCNSLGSAPRNRLEHKSGPGTARAGTQSSMGAGRPALGQRNGGARGYAMQGGGRAPGQRTSAGGGYAMRGGGGLACAVSANQRRAAILMGDFP
ncbi:hypothetical protein DFH08DRAFT_808383 [Mycena albidolilacea]|uniref:Uncharacterized protein n=1 Tax=Mycena albidolilacea TaxID=1033008 RepID=A0AAD7ERN9_9AGAR|nr:hypothetical protein DFH08DRAFT_808383 [Mycena albidolilacea]